MRTAILLTVFFLGLSAGPAAGSGIHTSIQEVNGNTIVSCTPDGKQGDIARARVFLYFAHSDEVFFATGIQPMDVSYENVATFELPGTYQTIRGTCKFIMLDDPDKVAREQFTITMR